MLIGEGCALPTADNAGNADNEEKEDDSVTVLVGDVMDGEESEDSVTGIHHCRCAAHTLNLMATTDISRVPGWNSGNRAPFTKVAAKAMGLWNYQKRITVAANHIKAAVGKKLPTPGATRWNSYFDSCEALLKVLNVKEKRESLDTVMRGQDLQPFIELDRELLTEFVKILKPVAICLDTLQSESKSYMGILLPNLRLMKDKLASLKTDHTIIHGKKLVEYLLNAFKGRFGHLFEDEDLLMGVALHPHFKLGVVKYINPNLDDIIKKRIVKEIKKDLNTPTSEDNGNNNDASVQVKPGTFEYMKKSMKPLAHASNSDKDIMRTLNSWTQIDVHDSENLSRDMFPTEHNHIWVNMFIKYNTAVPSSAAVERLFNMGSDILRPKRSRLTASNFEKLVFLKGNMNHLKGQWELVEGDDDNDHGDGDNY